MYFRRPERGSDRSRSPVRIPTVTEAPLRALPEAGGDLGRVGAIAAHDPDLDAALPDVASVGHERDLRPVRPTRSSPRPEAAAHIRTRKPLRCRVQGCERGELTPEGHVGVPRDDLYRVTGSWSGPASTRMGGRATARPAKRGLPVCVEGRESIDRGSRRKQCRPPVRAGGSRDTERAPFRGSE